MVDPEMTMSVTLLLNGVALLDTDAILSRRWDKGILPCAFARYTAKIPIINDAAEFEPMNFIE
jgi:hypothetical protein